MTVLRVVRPMRRKRSSFLQFRQRIPSDVLDRARGLTINIPIAPGIIVSKRIGPKACEIVISLRTRDKTEALLRHAAVGAHLERIWNGLRCKRPIALTHKQAVAAAGEFYRAWAEEPEGGDTDITAFELPLRGSNDQVQRQRCASVSAAIGSAHPDDHSRLWQAAAQSPSLNAERLAPLVERFMLSNGIAALDGHSRELVLGEAERGLRAAFRNRERNASGDYSPDPFAQRFPPGFSIADVRGSLSHDQSRPKRQKHSLHNLYEAWRVHPEQTHVAQSTKASYSSAIDSFARWLPSAKRGDASAITRDDVQGYVDHRLTKAKPKTVKDNDLTGLKSVFRWAMEKGLLDRNPADGIRVRVRKEPQTRVPRSKGFNDAEALAVLTHAYGAQRTNKKESPKTVAAKRWVPWLCAYSGARVGEMAQLRKQDVRREGEHWVLTLTPEAGTIKDKEAREIPVHPHLVEQGFIKFVEESGDGHLFLTPNTRTQLQGEGNPAFRYKIQPNAQRRARNSNVSRTDDERGILGPLKGVNNRLREFVRKVVTDERVQPNHAWRHRFKTVGREAGVSERVLDACPPSALTGQIELIA